MRPNVRMTLSMATIVLSALYGVLVVKAPQTAQAIMLGYVALLLTIIVVCHVWRKSG